MIRIHLEDATRDELQSMRRTALPPKVRDRIEMLTLADVGWSAPRIAAHRSLRSAPASRDSRMTSVGDTRPVIFGVTWTT
jgi:hypothetical protein